MESGVRIRIAEPTDIETIAELNLAMAAETEGKHLCRSTLVRGVRAVFDNADHGFYVVADSEGEVVGCLLVTSEWSDWRCGLFWWIQSLYVRPSFRRRGVLRQLHEFVQGQASRRPEICGLRLYVEQSNHLAQRAYRQIGMKMTAYRMYEQEWAKE